MTLKIRKVTGLATIQDLGWRDQRSIGLPPAGATDQASLRLGNALVGNGARAAGIELTLGSIEIETTRPVHVAVTGAIGEWRNHAEALPQHTTVLLAPGVPIRLSPAPHGRFCYLAVSGGADVPTLLGSRATYLPTGLGGWQGRRLRSGDIIPLGDAGTPPEPGTSAARLPETIDAPIRITGAGHTHLFDAAACDALAAAPYRVLPQSDRMGTRLAGPVLSALAGAALPSEGTCLGAIQVPGDGNPIVILQDGPTVGGYPKIAVVIGADLGRFAQQPLGGSVRFVWVASAAAERATRDAAAALDTLIRTIVPRDSTAR
ncbi:MAG: 5-oxoprolinase subunit C family protein [Gemmatimonadales bacterium]